MISAAMIVRDAETTIRAAIESLRPVVDEILVLDTGSKDLTVSVLGEIRASWAVSDGPPIRVERWAWRDDFSAARNEAQCRVSRGAEWIVVLDADEVLEPGNLRATVLSAPEAIDACAVRVECKGDGPFMDRFWSNRAYRKSRGRWIYPVHNQLVGPRRAARTTAVVRTDYTGLARNRMERSIPMLERLHAENPKDLHAPLFLARTYAANGGWEKTLYWVEIGIPLCKGEPGEVSLWIARAQALFALRGCQASEDALGEALAKYPDAPDLWHFGVMLSVAKWVEMAAEAKKSHTYDLSQEHWVETDDDLRRVQGAIEALELPLLVARSRPIPPPAPSKI